jgi:hypothetical protein
MKKLILLLFFASLLSLSGFAQQKITRYCFIKPVTSGLSNEMTVKRMYIDYGAKSDLTTYKDSSVIKDIEAVRKCKSYADINNYMESIGWKFAPGTGGVLAGDMIIFAFKKEFDKSEIVDNTINKP